MSAVLRSASCMIVPGMLYGAVIASTVPGGRLVDHVDDGAARAVPGVVGVNPLRLWGVGVVGTGFEAVHAGKEALNVT